MAIVIQTQRKALEFSKIPLKIILVSILISLIVSLLLVNPFIIFARSKVEKEIEKEINGLITSFKEIDQLKENNSFKKKISSLFVFSKDDVQGFKKIPENSEPESIKELYAPILIPQDKNFYIVYPDRRYLEGKVRCILSIYMTLLFLSVFLAIIAGYKIIRIRLIDPIEEIAISVNKAMNGDYSHKLSCNNILSERLKETYMRFNYLLELLELEEKERNFQLYTDTLTHLPNRQKILLDIEQTINPTLILMNIDFFKEINNCFGNTTGDLTLIAIAQRLKNLQNKFLYNLYKMSGDEFAFLFDRKIELEELYLVIKSLISEIEETPFCINGNEIFLKVSIGAARAEDINPKNLKEGKWKSLATHADMALKETKRLNKHFLIYHESMEIQKEFERNLIWKKKLKEAIDTHRVVPFFQPIMNNKTGKIEKYETLVRIVDKETGVITPSYFLEAAKKSHLYSKITTTILNKAITIFKDTNYEFSINLTIHDIIENEVKEFIIKTIAQNKSLAERIIFEILESEGIENYAEVIDFIKEVKSYGCKIAIDDFGSGYSNFDHLMKLDVDYIKLDSCLISNLETDMNAQIITRTIVSFAKELKIKTISEFVHSKEVLNKSIELGVDYSQGFYIGRPSQHIHYN